MNLKSMEKRAFDLTSEDERDLKMLGEKLFFKEFKKRHKDWLFYSLKVEDNKIVVTGRLKNWKST